jgi:hypothetical protein
VKLIVPDVPLIVVVAESVIPPVIVMLPEPSPELRVHVAPVVVKEIMVGE